MKLAKRYVLLSLCSLIFFAPRTEAAEKAFYQGKNVNFVINFAAGGPTDIEGRIVARHLARYIPGNPTIIVQNMPGAGGCDRNQLPRRSRQARRSDARVFHRAV